MARLFPRAGLVRAKAHFCSSRLPCAARGCWEAQSKSTQWGLQLDGFHGCVQP